MTNYSPRADLRIAQSLCDFVETELLADLAITPEDFWSGYANLIAKLQPLNRDLLAHREELQQKLDTWESQHKNAPRDSEAYIEFLKSIGYLVPEGAPFQIDTVNLDAEISHVAGPQLVVPVMNARFALNAANARWGSLYDALFGTDALDDQPGDKAQIVFSRVAKFLDAYIPLAGASHADAIGYTLSNGQLVAQLAKGTTGLTDASGLVGSTASDGQLSLIIKHNGLHIELVHNPSHPVGAQNKSGLSDVRLEAALTAIQDCEDSVAAVDAEDKVTVYRNWLGLMRGDLSVSMTKNGTAIERRLNADREITAPDGTARVLRGRALLLVRNVGHLMTTDAVLNSDGSETPEGFLDAMITVTAAMHDFANTENRKNSLTGSVYVVKPKMHGPVEVALANDLFSQVETILGLAKNTVKLGIMDEERRTSVNLTECIRAVRSRVFFINTGFLDRTGDELHTSMQAGPFVPRAQMAAQSWLAAYEDGNVKAGLSTGFPSVAQIGKGMWAKPDNMTEMLANKQGHLLAGANTAWVPSPTAAVLHAMHYHEILVSDVQKQMGQGGNTDLVSLLTPPLLGDGAIDPVLLQRELDSSCQSILGYVVRWIDQGIGCSKVPDIDDVNLMEDRATLRISAQYLANWLLHGVLNADQIDESLRRMAGAVDVQNADDAAYNAMSPDFDGSIAFQTARQLIFEGATQPSGYTEPLLHAMRRKLKSKLKGQNQ